MSLADIIILVIVILIVGGIIIYLARRNKNSCNTCSYAKGCDSYCKVIK